MDSHSSSATIIARSLLLQTPPGEFREAMNDITILCDNNTDVLLALSPDAQSYNIENVMEATIASPSDETSNTKPSNSESKKILVCKASLQPNAKFLDPRSQLSYSVDHVSLAATQPSSVSSPENSKLVALQKELDSYVKSTFPGCTALAFASKESGQETYDLHVVNTKNSLENFWNARWHSHWRWVPSKNSLSGKISGLVHLFEEGNVQLALKNEFNYQLEDEPSMEVAILKKIKAGEDTYHANIILAFEAINEKAYKRLRRILPITRSKFEWDKVATYKIGSELSKK